METTTVPLEPPDAVNRSRRGLRLPSGVRRLLAALRPSEPPLRTLWVVAVTPACGWGGMWVIQFEDWREADAAYERSIAQPIAGRGTHVVRLIPYRTSLRGQALLDELLALDDFDILPAAREFRP